MFGLNSISNTLFFFVGFKNIIVLPVLSTGAGGHPGICPFSLPVSKFKLHYTRSEVIILSSSECEL
jgi:hypothetical protein